MKNIKLILSSLLLIVAFTACNEKAKLAKSLEGSWTGSPEKLAATDDLAASSMIEIMQFTVNPDKTDGSLIVSGLISLTSPITDNIGAMQPISMSASGVITAQGSWTAVDDDEIMVYIDPKTITVDVDSSAVILNYSSISNEERPDLSPLKPTVAEHVKQQIKILAGAKIANMTKIDDIKIKDNLMSCEIGKQDLTFRRQTE